MDKLTVPNLYYRNGAKKKIRRSFPFAVQNSFPSIFQFSSPIALNTSIIATFLRKMSSG